MKIGHVLLFVMSSVLGFVQVTQAGEAAKPSLNKASIAFRIGENISLPDERFEQLLALFEKYKGITDEVTFFVAPTQHAPSPLETVRANCDILKMRMKRVRELGYGTGLNILCTIGHHEENLPYSVGPEFVRAANIHGDVTQGSLCPNQENFKEYIRELYRILVEAEPDYIWIDDDVRGGHMPVGATCFCDTCLRLFSEETGTEYTRETLLAKFGDHNVRKQWLQHNDDTISRLFALIQQTVHDLRPDLPLGFMTGERYYESYNFTRWAEILAGPDNIEVLWRPGGGFYRDEPIGALLGKSREIGRQVSLLPTGVRCIQSEIENFPYQRLMKSARVTALEAASHIASGCTGAAFNVLDEPLDEYEPLLAEIRRWRPFFDLLVKHTGREILTGVFPLWRSDAWVYEMGAVDHPEIDVLGIPWTPSAEGRRGVTILDSNSARHLSDEDLRTILSEGVFMDADTLDLLNSRSFGDLTGMEKLETFMVDSIERFTEHPLNGTATGRIRDCRQSFLWWRQPAHLLKKTDPNVQTLSERTDYSGQTAGDCLSAVYENRLGGRIFVGGYHPYNFLLSKTKVDQTREIMRWLSRDQIPAYVDSFHMTNLRVRELPDGGMAIAVMNHSFDAADNVALRIKTESDRIVVYDRTCKPREIAATSRDGSYRRFILAESLEPWDMCLVVVKP